MHDPSVSQRERNRIDTWNAIHRVASEVALGEGPASATIDSIAASAGVSRRTFFNYFACKEDAILGTRLPQVTDTAIDNFENSDDDELTRVVHLFVAVVRTSLPQEMTAVRRKIVAAHPVLRERILELLTEVEHLVTDVIRTRIDAGEDVALQSPAGDEDHLQALLMVAGMITKFAYSRYQESAEHDVTNLLPETIALIRKVVNSTR